MYVVSGHYDSRNTDDADAVIDAPGANDDASGTAAVMEMACVMARHQFDATVVFMSLLPIVSCVLGRDTDFALSLQLTPYGLAKFIRGNCLFKKYT